LRGEKASTAQKAERGRVLPAPIEKKPIGGGARRSLRILHAGGVAGSDGPGETHPPGKRQKKKKKKKKENVKEQKKKKKKKKRKTSLREVEQGRAQGKGDSRGEYHVSVSFLDR